MTSCRNQVSMSFPISPAGKRGAGWAQDTWDPALGLRDCVEVGGQGRVRHPDEAGVCPVGGTFKMLKVRIGNNCHP